MNKLSIKINIAGRVYPMKVDADSEERIRRSVRIIDERLGYYQQNYATKDKQDLLAMCLLEFVAKNESVKDNKVEVGEGLEDMLKMLDNLLTDNI